MPARDPPGPHSAGPRRPRRRDDPGWIAPWLPEARTQNEVVLLPSEQECLARVAGRTGHGFTDADATRHMHRQFAAADIDARHVLVDPTGPPEDVARAIVDRLAAGALRYDA